MKDKDIFHRSKISNDFIFKYNYILDIQFKKYKKKIIKDILEDLNKILEKKILKNI